MNKGRQSFGAAIDPDLIEEVDAFTTERGLVKWRFLTAALRLAMLAPDGLFTAAIAGDAKGIETYFAGREAAWAEHLVRQKALQADAALPAPLAGDAPAADGTDG